MKNVFLNRVSLLLLVVLVASLVAAARNGRGHRFGAGSPARREVRAYVAANVLPVLRQQRQKLETQLAPADQTQLATYRAQLQALRTQGQALRQSLRPAGSRAEVHPTLSEAQQAQVQALHTQSRGIMLNVAQLAQKYAPNIQQLAQEVEPQRTQWATDIKAIMQQNATPEQPDKAARWQGRAARPGGLHHFFRPAMFLLMDPHASAEAPATLGGTSLYPNPTAATAQLQFEVKKAGPVSLDLLDANGNKLRSIAPETQREKGTYTQSLDLSDLPQGTYFYKVTTRSGTETKRLVKE